MSGRGRLLCCINGSAHAARAMDFASLLAPALGLGLTFAAVNHLRPVSGYPPIRAWPPEKARQMLDAAVRHARSQEVGDVEAELIEAPDIAASIIDYALTHGVEHIVVGTGNPPFIGRLLIGSVSEAIIIGAHCSVTLAR